MDVAAPGVAILSTMQDTWEWCYLCWGEGYFEGYDSLSGTSMATSFVSALAALIWASGKCGTSNTCVRSRIEKNADAIAGTGTYWAKGRINFYKAPERTVGTRSLPRTYTESGAWRPALCLFRQAGRRGRNVTDVTEVPRAPSAG